jgi:gas vesicle protein
MRRQREMRRALSFLAGVFCGALVGAVAAILLAPYPGSELQERMRTRAQELVEKGQQAARAKRVEMETQLEAFKQGQSVVLQEPRSSSGE